MLYVRGARICIPQYNHNTIYHQKNRFEVGASAPLNAKERIEHLFSANRIERRMIVKVIFGKKKMLTE